MTTKTYKETVPFYFINALLSNDYTGLTEEQIYYINEFENFYSSLDSFDYYVINYANQEPFLDIYCGACYRCVNIEIVVHFKN